MADIFVSYAREDRPRVAPFIELLEKQGWSIWWDREVLPGHSFGNEIDKQIDQASCLIVFWSRHSVESNWVQVEANEGLERGILIPVLLEDVRVPLVFRRIETVPLFDWPDKHDDEQLKRILGAIASTLKSPRRQFVTEISRPPKKLPNFKIVISMVLLIFIGGAASFYVSQRTDVPPVAPTKVDIEKPIASIAVMPFTDMEVNIAPELFSLLSGTNNFHMVSPEQINAHLSNPGIIKLDARYSVQGSVEGSNLYVSMFDRTAGETVWQNTIDLDENLLSIVLQSIASDIGEVFHRPRIQIDEVSHVAYLSYLRAKALLRSDRGPEALKRAEQLFQESVLAAPRFAEGFAGLCETYTSLYLETADSQYFEAAERSCFRAATLSEGNSQVDFALGRLYRIAGRLDSSLERLDAALTKTPFSTAVLRELALVKMKQGLFEEAVSLVKAAQQLEPNYWKNYDDLAAMYFNTGRYQQAANQYEIVADLDGNKTRVLNDLGSAYFMAEEFDKAISAWNASLSSEPTSHSLSNLGSAYFFNGEFDAALTTYTRAIELAPTDARLRANSGEAAVQLGIDAAVHYEKAIQLATEQYKINPDNGEVVSLLASSYAALGDQNQAQEYINRALALASDDVYVLYDIAVAFAHLDKVEKKNEMIVRMIALGYSETLIQRDANLTRREQ